MHLENAVAASRRAMLEVEIEMWDEENAVMAAYAWEMRDAAVQLAAALQHPEDLVTLARANRRAGILRQLRMPRECLEEEYARAAMEEHDNEYDSNGDGEDDEYDSSGDEIDLDRAEQDDEAEDGRELGGRRGRAP